MYSVEYERVETHPANANEHNYFIRISTISNKIKYSNTMASYSFFCVEEEQQQNETKQTAKEIVLSSARPKYGDKIESCEHKLPRPLWKYTVQCHGYRQ